MNVKLANCTIPVWKLRKGAVVGFKRGEGVMKYYHIDGLINEWENVIVVLEEYGESFTVYPIEITWLEPH